MMNNYFYATSLKVLKRDFGDPLVFKIEKTIWSEASNTKH